MASARRTARAAASGPHRPLWRDGLILGAWLIAGYGTQTIALQTTTANRAAFFTALSVVLVPLWLTFAQRRRLSPALWLALPLAVAGLGLLSWEGGAFVVGDAWALACAVTYAGFIVTLERMAHRHEALRFTLAQLLAVTALMRRHLPPRARGCCVPCSTSAARSPPLALSALQPVLTSAYAAIGRAATA